MEQIIITKPNGSSYPLLNKQGVINVKSATQNMALLGEDVVNISIETIKKQPYEIGDTINIFGRTYKMNQLPKIQKTGTHSFLYDLVFEGVQYDLIRVTYDLTIDTTNNQLQDFQANTLTGNLRRFAEVLLANVERVFPQKWKLGNYPETTLNKTLTFGEADNCLLVLQNLCKEFNTEFYIEQKDGKNIIHFGKVGQVFPFPFSYGKGKGLYKLERQNVSSSNIITRLKVYGSTKNITNKYRANRLCLPNKSKQQSYIEKPETITKYGVWEATKYFEDIAPTRTGTITEVVRGNVFKFVDSQMFNLNEKEADGQTTKYLLAGTTAKIHFNTGNLAGYQFDVQSYDHATRTFTIKKLTDERNDTFPNASLEAFQFAVGDQYKLIDIALPPEFEKQAEQDLLQAGEKYYEQTSQPKVQYALSVSEDFVKHNIVGKGVLRNVFSVGDYIPIIDEDVNVSKSIRIQSFQREIFKPYQYTLTISDSVSTSIVNRIISDLIEVDKVIQINQLQDPAKAKRGWQDSQEIFNKVFDNEGYFNTEKIKPLSIETGMISVGSRMQQFSLPNVIFSLENNNTAVRNTIGQLVHLTIEDTPKTWQIPESVQTNLDANFHYIYVRAWRVGSMASIYISKEQIKVDAEAGYYYFLAGYLGSMENGQRRLRMSHGFTQINPFEITTGRIAPPSGNHHIELLHDRINIVGNLTLTGENVQQVKTAINPDLLLLENRLKSYTDNIQIGGRNLLRKTKEFSVEGSEYEILLNYAGDNGVASETFNGNVVRKINRTFQGYAANIPRIFGEPIIISFWAKSEGAAKFSNFAFNVDPDRIGGFTQLSNNGNIISDNQWHRYYIFNPKGMVFGIDNGNGFIEFFEFTSEILISSIKIEKGDKATDWSPAPEDTLNQIKEAERTLKAYADSQDLLQKTLIQAHADGKISEAEQRQISNAEAKLQEAKNHANNVVNNLQIGGRNLILNSHIEQPFYVDCELSEPLIEGETYTFSWESIGGVVGKVFINNSVIGWYDVKNDGSVWTRYAVTFVFTRNDYHNKLIFPHIYGATTVRKYKLERGDKATDWSPAPEDVQNKIANVKSDLEIALANARAMLDAEDRNIKEITRKLSEKTDFINETKINGNTVATGALLVGNTLGGNAGINGSGVSSNDVRFFAGSSISNRENAPFRVLDNGEAYTTKLHAQKGCKIGNLTITDYGLELADEIFIRQGKKTALYYDSVSFHENDNEFVKMGLNTLSSSSAMQSFFQIEKPNDDYGTFGSIITLGKKTERLNVGKGSTGQYLCVPKGRAIHIEEGVITGKHAVFEDGYMGASYLSAIRNNFTKTHVFIFTTRGEDRVLLPNANDIWNVLGTNNITFELTIICAGSFGGVILRIEGTASGHILNNNGQRAGGGNGYINMSMGDVLQLRYYGGDYYIISHRG